MAIHQIVRLRAHGVYRNFSWPSNLASFGQYNLIYGWNGSGKTTLSRLLRDLELRRAPKMGEVQLRVDGDDLRGPEFPTATVQLRVFNRDFIQESVFSVTGADVPPIFILGTESVEKQKQADRLKAEREVKQQALDTASRAKTRAENDLEKHCIDSGKIIKDTLQRAGSAYNTFNKGEYQRRAVKMVADADVTSHRLSAEERERLTAQHQSTLKPKVSKVNYRCPALQPLVDQVTALLQTTVVSTVIQGLRDDPGLSDWVRDGLSVHKSRESAKCLFCDQTLPPDRLSELEAHFNAAYERLLRQIDQQILRLETADTDACEAKTPNRAELYDDLSREIESAEQMFKQLVDALRRNIQLLLQNLQRKRSAAFTALTLSEAVETVDPSAIDELNAVIGRHNQMCDDFDRHVRDARDRLALGLIAETLEPYVRLRDALQTAAAALPPIATEIIRLTTDIENLESEIREHRRPAQQLNEDLKRYLGHGELHLTIKQNGYGISRNGVPAATLSEGEMSAISLLYFLKSLEDVGFDKNKGIVVLDDPVSSLDSNALFLAFSLIRDRTKDAAQLIVLTHDFALYRQMMNWYRRLNGKKWAAEPSARKARCYMVQCTSTAAGRESSIRWIDPLLDRYESEYHYLFACVHRASTTPASEGLEAFYHIPNVARRMLEAFLAFKVPQASGELYQALQLVPFDESKKTRILRFLHAQSHGFDVVPNHDPTGLGECPSVLSELFELMRRLDSGHVDAMIELAAAPPADQAGDRN